MGFSSFEPRALTHGDVRHCSGRQYSGDGGVVYPGCVQGGIYPGCTLPAMVGGHIPGYTPWGTPLTYPGM